MNKIIRIILKYIYQEAEDIYMLYRMCITVECIHSMVKSWNVYILQKSNWMYTFYDLIVECTHSMA